MKKGEATKQRIIEEAAEVFNRLGYSSTSMSTLMEATGLEKGGIYRHFSSKEELACEAFDYAIKLNHQSTCGALAGVEGGFNKIEKFITSFCSGKAVMSGGCPVMNTAVENDDGNPALKKKARGALKAWVDTLVSYVEEGKKEGSFKKNLNSEELVFFILSALEGALVFSNLIGKKDHLKSTGESVLEFVESKKNK
jgi:TetR/AcrR family transcriptional repressor of nem operon